MIIAQSAGVIQGSFADLWANVLQYVPQILAALVVFVLGWIAGSILYRLVIELVRALRIDVALKSAGVNDAAKEIGLTFDIGRFLGLIVEWFVIIVFLVASLDILGLNRVTIFLEQVVLYYLPQVLVAVLILVLAAVIAELVRGIVVSSVRATGSHSANLAGAVAKWAIWIFAALAALSQLGIAVVFIQTLFTGVVIALSLAFGLAFGLGGKDAAARTIEHIRSEISHQG
jgi:hypothetical protein